MDKFWTFIGDMTIWNWIALIAFIFFPLSALNAFFSLKTRYKDWQGTKSKQQFTKRLEELKLELIRIEAYKRNFPSFCVQVLEEAIPCLILGFAALALFIGAFTIYRLPLPGFKIFEFVYLCSALLLTFTSMKLLNKLLRLIRGFNHPDQFVKEVINFINLGKRKRFLAVGENDFIESFLLKDLFDEEVRNNLQGYLITEELKTAQQVFTKL